jgi:hypothetical protein
VGVPGWDDGTGYGILDVPAALVHPTPASDTPEPNDDIPYVDPTATDFSGFAPLTTPTRTAASASGRLTRFDDPRDVYRVWLPRNRSVTIRVTADIPATVQLFGRGAAQTVVGRSALADRLATMGTPTAAGSLTHRNTGAGRVAFVSVGIPKGGGRDIAYTLTVRAAPR